MYSNDILGQIIPIAADITSKQSTQRLVDHISARESKLHILINNAGISSSTRNTELEEPGQLHRELFKNQDTFEEWEEVMRTNVTQLFFTTTAFLPLLNKGTEDEYGWSSTIVNISSISGLVKSSQHHFAYNTSKAAAVHLTKMLAHEVITSRLKIRVNNIAPGVFPSEMTSEGSDEKQKSSIPKEDFEGKVPGGRPGKDEDMAGAVHLLQPTNTLMGRLSWWMVDTY